MTSPAKPAWLVIALGVALIYFAIGKLFAIPATSVQFWRLAAWVASAAVFTAHIWHERIRVANSASVAAFHVAVAAALGAFALALLVVAQKLAAPGPVKPIWFASLALWPVITGIPAFLVAALTGIIFVRNARGAGA